MRLSEYGTKSAVRNLFSVCGEYYRQYLLTCFAQLDMTPPLRDCEKTVFLKNLSEYVVTNVAQA